MKNIRAEIALWAQAITLIGLWVLFVYLSTGGLAVSLDAAKQVPDVLLVYGVIYWLFTRFVWRWRVLRHWLIPFPDLQGTWIGQLRSTWVNPETGESPQPIPFTLVIRQTFSSIHCSIYTAESASVSTAAAFRADEESGLRTLSYVYTNTPKVSVRHRSTTHDGAACLRVVDGDVVRLEGEYWTNRKTTGEISVTWRDSRLADSFQE